MVLALFTLAMIALGWISSKGGFVGKMFAFVFGLLGICGMFTATALFIITRIGAHVS